MDTNEQLDRDKLFANLAMLSGDRVLAPLGELQLRDAGGAGRNRRTSIGNGFIMDPQSGEIVRDPGYAEWERSRDELDAAGRARLQSDMLSRIGYGADRREQAPRYVTAETEGGIVPVQTNPAARGGAGAGATIPVQAPISESSAQAAAGFERTGQNLRVLQAQLQGNRGAVSSPKEIVKDIVGAVPFVGGTLRESAESAAYTPQQQEIRARAQTILNEYVKDLSGAAVSAQEIERIRAAFPFAPGVTFEAAMARFPAFIDSVDRRAAALRGARRAPAVRSQDLNIQPRGERKNVGGKWYEKVDGEWYEVN